MRSRIVRSLAIAAVVPAFALLLTAQGGPPPAQAPAGPPAEQVFKNIKVFNGKPAELVRPSMTYIAASLGVQCNFCHDIQDFSADTKDEKGTAREMVTMVFAINKDTFNNRNQVECFTCHQGHTQPNGNLAVATPETLAAMQAPAGRGGPGGGFGPGGPGGPGGPPGGGGRGGPQGGGMTPQQLLDKYVTGLGGQAAVDGVKSATITATRQQGGNSTPETITWKAGTYTESAGGRDSGYDGKEYYGAGRGGRETSSPDVAAYQQLDTPLFPGLALRSAPANTRVQGPRDVNGHSTLSVAVRSNGAIQTYSFDANTGLLYRFTTSTPTILGSLPLQVDFSDYKAFGGVQIPATVTYATANQIWTRQVTDVKMGQ